jgi:hypothetical protein
MPRPISRVHCALVLAAAALAASARAAPPPPSVLLAEVHNARMLQKLKDWIGQYTEAQRAVPASLQQLVRHFPEPDHGIAWIWLADRKLGPDYEILPDFGTQAWKVSARPTSGAPLSLFVAAGPAEPLRGGDNGGGPGSAALPPLALIELEKQLQRSLSGPWDMDALLRYRKVLDAQQVLHERTGAYACSFEELDAARAAGHRLVPPEIGKSDSYFDYELAGTRGEGGKCQAWLMRARSRLKAFPHYEMSGRQVWALPTDGPKRGMRLPLDQTR